MDLWKNKASPGGDDLLAAYQDYLTETKKKYGLPPTMVEGTSMTKRGYKISKHFKLTRHRTPSSNGKEEQG